MRNSRSLRYIVCLAALFLSAALCALSACSDQVLNPDGTIGRPGETSAPVPGSGVTGSEVLTRPEGTGEVPATQETLVLDPGSEETTRPTISIDPDVDPYANAAHKMYVEFLKTGSSDCLLILADDCVVLVDAGETDDYATIRAALAAHNVTAIDHFIITHFDNDHIGCASRILGDYPVGTVYMPDYVRDSKLYRNLTAQLSADGCTTHVRRLYAEDVELDLGYGKIWINATALENHAPGQTLGSDEGNNANEENDFSLITTITFGQVRLLLAGDAEQDRLQEFLPLCATRGIKSYSLIKIPHHGRSDDKALLSALRTLLPRYCVVCAADRGEVSGALDTCMRSIGAGRYYTYDGGITFSTDGTGMTVTRK